MPATAPISTQNKRGRGRPPKFSDNDKAQARLDYLAGDSAVEIGKRLGCSDRTIRHWIKRGGWEAELHRRRETISGLEAEIHHLSQKKRLGDAHAQRLAMLTKSLDRLQKTMPQPKPKPLVANAMHADLLQQVLSEDYGLYSYQKAELQNTCRFGITLKSRQIGYSYLAALRALLGAAAGRDQNILSASQDQSDIVRGYCEHHAERLDLSLKADGKALKMGGSRLRFLPANFRTAQGYAGDLHLDEFAWQQNPKRIWAAAFPGITAVGGMVRIFSTPFVPGSLFWEIATNHQNKWAMWHRTTITIHDAVAQGMNLPGGIEELRANFDSESWAMMYECQWAEDGSALIGWKQLEELPKVNPNRLTDLPLYIGMDVGRINDRTALAAYYWDSRKERWALAFWEEKKGQTFEAQQQWIADLHRQYRIARFRIDKTGLGMQLAEQAANDHPCTQGVWFSAERKQRMALDFTKLVESQGVAIHNDPDLFARLHAVKRKVCGERVKYDAGRDNTGHGDTFWAHALALEGLNKGPSGGESVIVEVW